MPNGIIKSKSEQDKADRDLAQKVKPKLRKFVIDSQVQEAATTAKQLEDAKQEDLNADDIIGQAIKLSAIAFFEDRLWEEYPPAVSMPWLHKVGMTQHDRHEQNIDLAGFSRFLVVEFRTYLKHRGDPEGYPNPMDRRNLPLYWQRFNLKLLELIAADQRRIKAGNKGVILAGEDTNEQTNVDVEGGND